MITVTGAGGPGAKGRGPDMRAGGWGPDNPDTLHLIILTGISLC